MISTGIPELSDVSVLGYGGYSTVYLARHEGLGRRVAVKVVGRIDDPDRQAEFDRECAAMGRLSDHLNVVAPLSAGVSESGERYLVLEYYPDGSCAELVGRLGPLSVEQVMDWIDQVGGALDTAHERGIIHNDVKPENILVREDRGRLRYAVTDFGLAHLVDGHTGKGISAGSLMYVAPELLDGSRPTQACDVYGLAATAHFMRSGSPVFRQREGESWMSVLRRIGTDPAPTDAFDGLPAEFARVLLQCLDKNPAARPPLRVLLDVARTVEPVDFHVVPAPNHEPLVDQEQRFSNSLATTQGDASESRLRLGWFVAALIVLFVVSVVIGRLIS